MKFLTAGDWSVGINRLSSSSLSDAEILALIGRDLQTMYRDLVQEPLPEHLTVIVEKLEEPAERSKSASPVAAVRAR